MLSYGEIFFFLLVTIDLIVVLWICLVFCRRLDCFLMVVSVPMDLVVALWKVIAPMDLVVVLWKIFFSTPMDLVVVLWKIFPDLIKS